LSCIAITSGWEFDKGMTSDANVAKAFQKQILEPQTKVRKTVVKVAWCGKSLEAAVKVQKMSTRRTKVYLNV